MVLTTEEAWCLPIALWEDIMFDSRQTSDE